MQPVEFEPIGLIRTIYKEKFGIPKQSGLVETPAVIEFSGEYAREEAVRGLERFSHIWVLFHFHQSEDRSSKDKGRPPRNWAPMVRPPRLGGNKKVGVFASRSPFRPNGIGMSVVRLERIEISENGPQLFVSGADLLDRTPVLDIKPYLPYSDAVADAKDGFGDYPEGQEIKIEFTGRAEAAVCQKTLEIPGLKDMIVRILKCDPRPAYRRDAKEDEERIYGMKLFDFNLTWKAEGETFVVQDLSPAESDK